MPASHDVTLPRSVVPVFPDRCPCSGQAGPGKAVRLSFVGYSAPSLVDQVVLGPTSGGNTLDYVIVPASEACAAAPLSLLDQGLQVRHLGAAEVRPPVADPQRGAHCGRAVGGVGGAGSLGDHASPGVRRHAQARQHHL